jgi:hypothetical protein
MPIGKVGGGVVVDLKVGEAAALEQSGVRRREMINVRHPCTRHVLRVKLNRLFAHTINSERDGRPRHASRSGTG